MTAKTMIASLGKLVLAWVLTQAFTSSIATHYKVPAPGYEVCLNVVMLLTIAGYLLRGKAPYFFDEE